MSAYIYILRRNKEFGYYQNDMKCEFVAEFMDWDALEYVGSTARSFVEPCGTTILSAENQMGRVLKTSEEYIACLRENIEASLKDRFGCEKYEFYYRVEKDFIEELLKKDNLEDYENNEWLVEQMEGFKDIAKTLDFDKYYYYVVEDY